MIRSFLEGFIKGVLFLFEGFSNGFLSFFALLLVLIRQIIPFLKSAHAWWGSTPGVWHPPYTFLGFVLKFLG